MIFRRIRSPLALLLAAFIFLTQVVFPHRLEANFWEERSASRRSSASSSDSTLLASLPNSIAPLASIRVGEWERGRGGEKTNAFSPSLRLSGSSALLQAVPQNRARIAELYVAKGSKEAPLVLIQDVHLNPEAQLNIAATLQSLIDAGQISSVGVEGAFGKFDFARFRNYSDKAATKDALAQLVNQRLLAAPSFVGVTSAGEPPVFTGVDDRTHYDANVQAYLQTRKLLPSVQKQLADQSARLTSQSASVFSANVRRFAQARVDQHQGKISLGEYLGTLQTLGAHTDDLTVEQFLEAFRLEKSLNFSQVEAQRRTILVKLSNALSSKESQQLIAFAAAMKEGQLTAAEFHQALRDLCRSHHISLASAPAFDDYIRYVLLADSIKAEKLFAAVAAMENNLIDTLASPAEKSLLSEIHQLELSQKLVKFELTSEEWKEYARGRVGEGASGGISSSIPKANENFLNAFERFYDEADIRSQSMLKNLMASSPSRPLAPSPTQALICGGFHTSELTELLKKQNRSFVVLSPILTKVNDGEGSTYLTAFEREKTPLDHIVAGKKLFIAPEDQNIGPKGTSGMVMLAPALANAANKTPNVQRDGNTARTVDEDGIAIEASFGSLMGAERTWEINGRKVSLREGFRVNALAPLAAMARKLMLRLGVRPLFVSLALLLGQQTHGQIMFSYGIQSNTVTHEVTVIQPKIEPIEIHPLPQEVRVFTNRWSQYDFSSFVEYAQQNPKSSVRIAETFDRVLGNYHRVLKNQFPSTRGKTPFVFRWFADFQMMYVGDRLIHFNSQIPTAVTEMLLQQNSSSMYKKQAAAYAQGLRQLQIDSLFTSLIHGSFKRLKQQSIPLFGKGRQDFKNWAREDFHRKFVSYVSGNLEPRNVRHFSPQADPEFALFERVLANPSSGREILLWTVPSMVLALLIGTFVAVRAKYLPAKNAGDSLSDLVARLGSGGQVVVHDIYAAADKPENISQLRSLIPKISEQAANGSAEAAQVLLQLSYEKLSGLNRLLYGQKPYQKALINELPALMASLNRPQPHRAALKLCDSLMMNAKFKSEIIRLLPSVLSPVLSGAEDTDSFFALIRQATEAGLKLDAAQWRDLSVLAMSGWLVSDESHSGFNFQERRALINRDWAMDHIMAERAPQVFSASILAALADRAAHGRAWQHLNLSQGMGVTSYGLFAGVARSLDLRTPDGKVVSAGTKMTFDSEDEIPRGYLASHITHPGFSKDEPQILLLHLGNYHKWKEDPSQQPFYFLGKSSQETFIITSWGEIIGFGSPGAALMKQFRHSDEREYFVFKEREKFLEGIWTELEPQMKTVSDWKNHDQLKPLVALIRQRAESFKWVWEPFADDADVEAFLHQAYLQKIMSHFKGRPIPADKLYNDLGQLPPSLRNYVYTTSERIKTQTAPAAPRINFSFAKPVAEAAELTALVAGAYIEDLEAANVWDVLGQLELRNSGVALPLLRALKSDRVHVEINGKSAPLNAEFAESDTVVIKVGPSVDTKPSSSEKSGRSPQNTNKFLNWFNGRWAGSFVANRFMNFYERRFTFGINGQNEREAGPAQPSAAWGQYKELMPVVQRYADVLKDIRELAAQDRWDLAAARQVEVVSVYNEFERRLSEIKNIAPRVRHIVSTPMTLAPYVVEMIMESKDKEKVISSFTVPESVEEVVKLVDSKPQWLDLTSAAATDPDYLAAASRAKERFSHERARLLGKSQDRPQASPSNSGPNIMSSPIIPVIMMGGALSNSTHIIVVWTLGLAGLVALGVLRKIKNPDSKWHGSTRNGKIAQAVSIAFICFGLVGLREGNRPFSPLSYSDTPQTNQTVTRVEDPLSNPVVALMMKTQQSTEKISSPNVPKATNHSEPANHNLLHSAFGFTLLATLGGMLFKFRNLFARQAASVTHESPSGPDGKKAEPVAAAALRPDEPRDVAPTFGDTFSVESANIRPPELSRVEVARVLALRSGTSSSSFRVDRNQRSVSINWSGESQVSKEMQTLGMLTCRALELVLGLATKANLKDDLQNVSITIGQNYHSFRSVSGYAAVVHPIGDSTLPPVMVEYFFTHPDLFQKYLDDDLLQDLVSNFGGKHTPDPLANFISNYLKQIYFYETATSPAAVSMELRQLLSTHKFSRVLREGATGGLGRLKVFSRRQGQWIYAEHQSIGALDRNETKIVPVTLEELRPYGKVGYDKIYLDAFKSFVQAQLKKDGTNGGKVYVYPVVVRFENRFYVLTSRDGHLELSYTSETYSRIAGQFMLERQEGALAKIVDGKRIVLGRFLKPLTENAHEWPLWASRTVEGLLGHGLHFMDDSPDGATVAELHVDLGLAIGSHGQFISRDASGQLINTNPDELEIDHARYSLESLARAGATLDKNYGETLRKSLLLPQKRSNGKEVDHSANLPKFNAFFIAPLFMPGGPMESVQHAHPYLYWLAIAAAATLMTFMLGEGFAGRKRPGLEPVLDPEASREILARFDLVRPMELEKIARSDEEKQALIAGITEFSQFHQPDLDQQVGFLKGLALSHNQIGEVGTAIADGDEAAYQRLVYSFRPYVAKAHQERNHFISSFVDHDGAYDVLRERVESGASGDDVLIVNVDHHDDLENTDPGVLASAGITPATWVTSSLKDRLAAKAVNVFFDDDGKPYFRLSTADRPYRTGSRLISASEFIALLRKNKIFLTVDADAYSCRLNPEAGMTLYHLDSTGIAARTRTVKSFFDKAGASPFRVVLAESPEWVADEALKSESWFSDWKNQMREIWTPKPTSSVTKFHGFYLAPLFMIGGPLEIFKVNHPVIYWGTLSLLAGSAFILTGSTFIGKKATTIQRSHEDEKDSRAVYRLISFAAVFLLVMGLIYRRVRNSHDHIVSRSPPFENQLRPSNSVGELASSSRRTFDHSIQTEESKAFARKVREAEEKVREFLRNELDQKTTQKLRQFNQQGLPESDEEVLTRMEESFWITESGHWNYEESAMKFRPKVLEDATAEMVGSFMGQVTTSAIFDRQFRPEKYVDLWSKPAIDTTTDEATSEIPTEDATPLQPELEPAQAKTEEPADHAPVETEPSVDITLPQPVAGNVEKISTPDSADAKKPALPNFAAMTQAMEKLHNALGSYRVEFKAAFRIDVDQQRLDSKPYTLILARAVRGTLSFSDPKSGITRKNINAEELLKILAGQSGQGSILPQSLARFTRALVRTAAVIALALQLSHAQTNSVSAKFLPPPGKKLVFIGQDVTTIQNYVENVKMEPAGLMAYAAIDDLRPLTMTVDFGGGPQNAEELLKKFPNSPIQLALGMVGALSRVTSHELDGQIEELAAWIKKANRPIYLRLGYEFDFPGNNYSPKEYVAAYRYVVDHLRAAGVEKYVSFVWHSYSAPLASGRTLRDYWPGKEYVDFVGISFFRQPYRMIEPVIMLAEDEGVPVIVAEGSYWHQASDANGAQLTWLNNLFSIAAKHDMRIISVIPAKWDSQSLFNGNHWGNFELNQHPDVLAKWQKEMSNDSILQPSPVLFQTLGFSNNIPAAKSPVDNSKIQHRNAFFVAPLFMIGGPLENLQHAHPYLYWLGIAGAILMVSMMTGTPAGARSDSANPPDGDLKWLDQLPDKKVSTPIRDMIEVYEKYSKGHPHPVRSLLNKSGIEKLAGVSRSRAGVVQIICHGWNDEAMGRLAVYLYRSKMTDQQIDSLQMGEVFRDEVARKQFFPDAATNVLAGIEDNYGPNMAHAVYEIANLRMTWQEGHKRANPTFNRADFLEPLREKILIEMGPRGYELIKLRPTVPMLLLLERTPEQLNSSFATLRRWLTQEEINDFLVREDWDIVRKVVDNTALLEINAEAISHRIAAARAQGASGGALSNYLYMLSEKDNTAFLLGIDSETTAKWLAKDSFVLFQANHFRNTFGGEELLGVLLASDDRAAFDGLIRLSLPYFHSTNTEMTELKDRFQSFFSHQAANIASLQNGRRSSEIRALSRILTVLGESALINAGKANSEKIGPEFDSILASKELPSVVEKMANEVYFGLIDKVAQNWTNGLSLKELEKENAPLLPLWIHIIRLVNSLAITRGSEHERLDIEPDVIHRLQKMLRTGSREKMQEDLNRNFPWARLSKQGYSHPFLDRGIEFTTQADPLTRHDLESLVAANRLSQTEQILQTAVAVEFFPDGKSPEELRALSFKSAAEARAFVERMGQEARDSTNPQISQARQLVQQMEKDEKLLSQPMPEVAPKFVTVSLKKDFLTEASVGMLGYSGCFIIHGAHEEMPLKHALEGDSMIATMKDEKGDPIANAVIIFTDKGALVFPSYTADRTHNLDAVWFEAFKLMSNFTPNVYLIPARTMPASAGWMQAAKIIKPTTFSTPEVLSRPKRWRYFYTDETPTPVEEDHAGLHWKIGQAIVLKNGEFPDVLTQYLVRPSNQWWQDKIAHERQQKLAEQRQASSGSAEKIKALFALGYRHLNLAPLISALKQTQSTTSPEDIARELKNRSGGKISEAELQTILGVLESKKSSSSNLSTHHGFYLAPLFLAGGPLENFQHAYPAAFWLAVAFIALGTVWMVESGPTVKYPWISKAQAHSKKMIEDFRKAVASALQSSGYQSKDFDIAVFGSPARGDAVDVDDLNLKSDFDFSVSPSNPSSDQYKAERLREKIKENLERAGYRSDGFAGSNTLSSVIWGKANDQVAFEMIDSVFIDESNHEAGYFAELREHLSHAVRFGRGSESIAQLAVRYMSDPDLLKSIHFGEAKSGMRIIYFFAHALRVQLNANPGANVVATLRQAAKENLITADLSERSIRLYDHLLGLRFQKQSLSPQDIATVEAYLAETLPIAQKLNQRDDGFDSLTASVHAIEDNALVKAVEEAHKPESLGVTDWTGQRALQNWAAHTEKLPRVKLSAKNQPAFRNRLAAMLGTFVTDISHVGERQITFALLGDDKREPERVIAAVAKASQGGRPVRVVVPPSRMLVTRSWMKNLPHVNVVPAGESLMQAAAKGRVTRELLNERLNLEKDHAFLVYDGFKIDFDLGSDGMSLDLFLPPIERLMHIDDIKKIIDAVMSAA